MNFIRKILFPLSILYSAIASIRNYCYDKGLLKSYAFNLPIIVVGNISVGGTGKTPQIEYLIRLLTHKYKVATLSRGYKRKSSGFIPTDVNKCSNGWILFKLTILNPIKKIIIKTGKRWPSNLPKSSIRKPKNWKPPGLISFNLMNRLLTCFLTR